MLGQDVVPARYLRDDHARCKRFGHDPSLDLIAPPPATTRTDLDVDPTPWLRTVDYMLNHICEPICVRCVACCRSARGRQGGGRRPLTLYWDPTAIFGSTVGSTRNMLTISTNISR